MAELERSAFIWTLPTGAATREAIAVAVAAGGTRKLYIKAGGDNGAAVWIPGVALPSWARPQWDDAYLAPFTARGILCVPWFYNWYGDADLNAIVRAVGYRPSAELVLNPETEWRVQSSANPFRTLDEANEAAFRWVIYLRDNIRDIEQLEPRIGFSSVPSWPDFPYEGFARACDFALEQHYWFPSDIAGGLDEVGWHLDRAGKAKPHVPVLTASREHDDAGVVQLARNALAQDPDLAGFSSWEAANGAYQVDAVAASYALLDGLARRDPLDFAAAVEGATDLDDLLERVLT
jgi:hypothetical protein